jgi:hypothetical protein
MTKSGRSKGRNTEPRKEKVREKSIVCGSKVKVRPKDAIKLGKIWVLQIGRQNARIMWPGMVKPGKRKLYFQILNF